MAVSGRPDSIAFAKLVHLECTSTTIDAHKGIVHELECETTLPATLESAPFFELMACTRTSLPSCGGAERVAACLQSESTLQGISATNAFC